MPTIVRDNLRQSADAARAADCAVIIGANIEQPKDRYIIDSENGVADAPFLLVIVDTAGKRFSVEGPMIDATEWRNVIYLAQRFGNRLLYFVKAGSSRSHMARVAHEIRQSFGHRHVAAGSIVRPVRLQHWSALTA